MPYAPCACTEQQKAFLGQFNETHRKVTCPRSIKALSTPGFKEADIDMIDICDCIGLVTPPDCAPIDNAESWKDMQSDICSEFDVSFA